MLGALITLVVLIAVGGPGAAQGAQAPAADAPRGRMDQPPGGPTNAELINMLDTYALVQAQERLQLDDDRYGRFVVRLKKLQETQRKSQQERNQIIQDLRKLANPPVTQPDENAIRERLKALRDHDERAAADLRRAYDAVDDLLTVTQQARFRVFEENIERRKLDLLVRARERAARRPQRRGGRKPL